MGVHPHLAAGVLVLPHTWCIAVEGKGGRANASGMEDRQRQLVAQPVPLAMNGGSLRVITEQASSVISTTLSPCCQCCVQMRRQVVNSWNHANQTLLRTWQTASWVQELETEVGESWRHLPLYFCEVRHFDPCSLTHTTCVLL